MRFSFIAATIATVLTASAAQAAVIVNVQEVGTDVVIDYSGTLDLTGMDLVGVEPAFGGVVEPGVGLILNGATSYDVYAIAGGVLMPHGAGAQKFATSATGTAFGFSGLSVGVPVFYTGAALSGTLTFTGASLASLGYAPGVYNLSLPSDTITTYVGVTADVPLPAAAPMLLGALALTGFAARRRKG